MSKAPEYCTRNIDQLIPYARNSRTHSEAQIAEIAASIKQFGWTNPVLIDGNDEVIAGHGRILAAPLVGITEIPCIRITHFTEAQRRAYVIADNKIALNAGWDEEMLKMEFDSLKELDFDLSITGFSLDEIGEFYLEPKTSENSYTSKVKSPTYEPEGEQPPLSEVFDTSKTRILIDQINEADIPDDVKTFLRAAAFRHTVFNYERIASYYAHSPAPIQELMENSALVIIDFEKAIEQGYVKLNDELAGMFFADVEATEDDDDEE